MKAIGATNGEGSEPHKPVPGIAFGELTGEQKGLVEAVMKSLLDPFRAADVAEALQLVKANGGMDQIHVAYFKEPDAKDKQPWHSWRVEGPGFVWNFRVLPHVHTYVNISTRIS